MAASVTGAYAVAQGFASILQSNLDDILAEVMAAAGNPFDFSAPSSHSDYEVSYSFSPTWVPRDRYNGIQIWVDSTSEEWNYMNLGGPRTERVVVGVLWLLHAANPSTLEQKKQLGTAAIKRAITKYWRRDMSSAAIYNVKFDPTDFRFSSLRMQGGSRRGLIGHITDTGDNIDAVIVGINCMQQVDAPVELS